MTANLAPCPFCKRDSMIIHEDELSEGFVFEGECTECNYRTPTYSSDYLLIEAHNKISKFEAHAVEVLAKVLDSKDIIDYGPIDRSEVYIREAKQLLGWEDKG